MGTGKKNRAEAKNVSIYEYDGEKHPRMEREEWLEDGLKQGRLKVLTELVEKKRQKERYFM